MAITTMVIPIMMLISITVKVITTLILIMMLCTKPIIPTRTTLVQQLIPTAPNIILAIMMIVMQCAIKGQQTIISMVTALKRKITGMSTFITMRKNMTKVMMKAFQVEE